MKYIQKLKIIQKKDILFLETNEFCRLFGKSYKIKNGDIIQICDDNEYIDIFSE